MQKIRDLVSHAVGIAPDGLRPDSIEVVEMPFFVDDVGVGEWWKEFPFGFNLYGQWGIAAVVLLVAFLVMRSVMSNLSIRQEEAGVEVGQLTGDVDDDEDEGEEGDGAVAVLKEEVRPMSRLEEQLQHIADVNKQNPRAVAAWIASVVEG